MATNRLLAVLASPLPLIPILPIKNIVAVLVKDHRPEGAGDGALPIRVGGGAVGICGGAAAIARELGPSLAIALDLPVLERVPEGSEEQKTGHNEGAGGGGDDGLGDRYVRRLRRRSIRRRSIRWRRGRRRRHQGSHRRRRRRRGLVEGRNRV